LLKLKLKRSSHLIAIIAIGYAVDGIGGVEIAKLGK
jgi:hypothetical protein